MKSDKCKHKRKVIIEARLIEKDGNIYTEITFECPDRGHDIVKII